MSAPPDRRRLLRSLHYTQGMTVLNAALTVYLAYRLVITGVGRSIGAVVIVLAVAAVTVAGAVYAQRLKKQLAE